SWDGAADQGRRSRSHSLTSCTSYPWSRLDDRCLAKSADSSRDQASAERPTGLIKGASMAALLSGHHKFFSVGCRNRCQPSEFALVLRASVRVRKPTTPGCSPDESCKVVASARMGGTKAHE